MEEKIYNEKELELIGMLIAHFKSVNDVNLTNAIADPSKIAEELVDSAIKESKDNHCYNLPKNFGDLILESEKTGQMILKNLKEIRADGVSDDDIRQWWNLDDVERRVSVNMMEINKLYLFNLYKQRDGLTPKDAVTMSLKYYPLFGDPKDTSRFQGNDRPLPQEFLPKIDAYMRMRSLEREQYEADLKESSSFNALFRKNINVSH